MRKDIKEVLETVLIFMCWYLLIIFSLTATYNFVFKDLEPTNFEILFLITLHIIPLHFKK